MELTNRSIVAKAPDVFDNVGAYQVPMAGRRDELATIIASLATPSPTITVVSAPLGSGKTFLLNQCFKELLTQGFVENRNRFTVLASKIKPRDRWREPLRDTVRDRLADADPRFRRVCIVEELDRKSRLAELEAVVDETVGWLESEPSGCLILTGDRFLDHPLVEARISASGVPRFDVKLASLDRSLMLEAIARRVNQIVVGGSPDGFASSLPAAEELLRDPLVERCIIPPTSPAISNFREAFGLLRRLSGFVELSTPGIDFGHRFLKRLSGPRDLPSEQRATDSFVADVARIAVRSGQPAPPITLETLFSKGGLTYDADVYRKRVVDSLVRLGCLVPMGIPYLSGGSVTDSQYVGPYLPKQDIFVDVAAELSSAAP